MEFKKISKAEDGTTVFKVKGTTPAQLNTYRRMIINKLPSMAIDTVEIIDNSSGLYDEMVAHRLGLLVLKTDVKSYILKEREEDDGPTYELKLTLEVKGPGVVYAEELKSDDPNVYPVHKKTPITKLREDQNIKLIATAIMGTGKEHIKFSPGLMFYQKFPTLKTKEMKKIEAITKECPIDEGKSKFEAHELCKSCLGLLEQEKLIETNNTDFLVTIEPWGQLSAIEIMEGVVEVTNNQLEALSSEIKKLK
jgi:DNA-directed RNA polymerase subunit D